MSHDYKKDPERIIKTRMKLGVEPNPNRTFRLGGFWNSKTQIGPKPDIPQHNLSSDRLYQPDTTNITGP